MQWDTCACACANLDVSVKQQKIETRILGTDALWLKIQGYSYVYSDVYSQWRNWMCCTKEVAGNSVVMHFDSHDPGFWVSIPVFLYYNSIQYV